MNTGWAVDCTQKPSQEEAIKCCSDAGFETDPAKRCFKRNTFAWVTIGGDWYTTLWLGNEPKADSPTGGIKASWGLVSMDGLGSMPPVYAFNSIEKITTIGQSVSYPLSPGESFETIFLYPAHCTGNTSATCIPDPDRLVTGSLIVTYTANDPAVLGGLTGAELRFFRRDSIGSTVWQVSQFEQNPAAKWVFSASETEFVRKSLDWQNTLNTAFAVANPMSLPTTVIVTLVGSKNNLVAEKRIRLNSFETRSYMLADFFGDKMFPNQEDFIGKAYIEVGPDSVPLDMPGRKVVVTAFQMKGNSLGNLSPRPIRK